MKDIFMGGIDVSFNFGTPSGVLGLCSSTYESNTTQSGISLVKVSTLRNINISVKSGLKSSQQSLVLAHELGHALNVKTTILGSVPTQTFQGWKNDEIAGFRAQFDTASELFNSAAGPHSRDEWKNALQATLPRELQAAFSKYDMTKGFDDQSGEFKNSFSNGLNQYVQKTYFGGE